MKQNSSLSQATVPQLENHKQNITPCWAELKSSYTKETMSSQVHKYILGTACGKFHRVSTMAILNAGDSDILNA